MKKMSNIAHGQPLIEIIATSTSHQAENISRKEMMQEIGNELLLDIYRKMVRSRSFDEKIKEMLARGHKMSLHSSIGQEAGPVGACAALRDDDYIMPYHRGSAWAIGKGLEPKYIYAELEGKKTGYCKGKGGPHLGCYEKGVLGRSGVQGAHLSIAAGVGLAVKQEKSDKVVMTFFGNGASNTGNFHEGLNLAGVWKAPVIYFCENNLYQITCTMEETSSVEDIADRASGYGMPGYIVDGNDAVAVYYVAKKAVERARRGEGPTLIETKTYRWEGHNVMDVHHKGGYRSIEEIEEWKKKCPIALMERELKEIGLLTDADIEQIKAEAKSEMDEAMEYASSSPYPDREDYYTDVFAEEEGVR
jgi:pyruvate dehydrogenase E1 component alpha subunit